MRKFSRISKPVKRETVPRAMLAEHAAAVAGLDATEANMGRVLTAALADRDAARDRVAAALAAMTVACNLVAGDVVNAGGVVTRTKGAGI